MTLTMLLSLQFYTPLNNTTSDFPEDHLGEVRPRCPHTDTHAPVLADTPRAKEQN